MITDVNELIRECSDELVNRQYKPDYARVLTEHWKSLSEWMEANSLTVFSLTVANRYCDLHIVSHILTDGMDLKTKQHLRAVRMLVSYQKDGEFEFRSPRVEYLFSGQIGSLMNEFLAYATDELHRATTTIEEYRCTLSKFNHFLYGRLSKFNIKLLNPLSKRRFRCVFGKNRSTKKAEPNGPALIICLPIFRWRG